LPFCSSACWTPWRQSSTDAAAPRYLDESALDTPSLALADAARETLRMGDMVETMLRQVMLALMTDNRALVSEVSRTDNTVDKLHEAIKLYVTKLTRGSLDEAEGRRAMEIISFGINLEHIGDIIDKNLAELAAKKIKRKLQFSAEGAEELTAFHKRIVENLRIGLNVFMAGDINGARSLIAAKAQLRNAELAAAERHFERLREGRPETCCATCGASIRTSALCAIRCWRPPASMRPTRRRTLRMRRCRMQSRRPDDIGSQSNLGFSAPASSFCQRSGLHSEHNVGSLVSCSCNSSKFVLPVANCRATAVLIAAASSGWCVIAGRSGNFAASRVSMRIGWRAAPAWSGCARRRRSDDRPRTSDSRGRRRSGSAGRRALHLRQASSRVASAINCCIARIFPCP
jgi:hypothetical protein